MTEHRTPAPPEPPIGTWVRATRKRPGADRVFVSCRQKDGWGEPDTYPGGEWKAMWESWGPLEVCGSWGIDLADDLSEAMTAEIDFVRGTPVVRLVRGSQTFTLALGEAEALVDDLPGLVETARS